MSSDTESEVSSEQQEEEEVQLEPMLTEMESRKKKRLDQLAAARKKSLEVRKVKNEPKKKRIELQAQVNKQLYDVEVARVAELEKVLALSEERNRELSKKSLKKVKSSAKTLLKHKPLKKVVEVSSEEEEDRAQSAEEARMEFMMRQLYSARQFCTGGEVQTIHHQSPPSPHGHSLPHHGP